MFRSLPFILIIIIAAILFINPYLPLNVKEICYAISLTVKSVIVFILPVVIFSLLFKTMVGLASRATAVIALILVCLTFSNFISTFLSHYVGGLIYHFDFTIIKPREAAGLTAAWTWQFPKLIDNNKAMFAGIVLGIILGNFRKNLGETLSDKLNWFAGHVLKSFMYLIPIFVAGFVVKLQHDGVIHIIFKDYAFIFLIIGLSQFLYLLFVYAALNNFNLQHTFTCIKNMLPATIAGFSTMSSASVMPLTMIGAEKNAHNKHLARSIIPSTVNIHLLGDCIAIPIFAYALMKSFGIPEPTLITYVTFTFYFVLAKYSVAAVPGGGIIVMLPILENYLGFNAEMLSLITALYILFDPVITCANVLGNGALAKLIDKIMMTLSQKKIFSARIADLNT